MSKLDPLGEAPLLETIPLEDLRFYKVVRWLVNHTDQGVNLINQANA